LVAFVSAVSVCSIMVMFCSFCGSHRVTTSITRNAAESKENFVLATSEGTASPFVRQAHTLGGKNGLLRSPIRSAIKWRIQANPNAIPRSELSADGYCLVLSSH
jgi:hypothetical protein